MTLRQIKPIEFPELPMDRGVAGINPEFEWVHPTDLLVDEAYQRGLSQRSIQLIERIVTHFDWRRFKPPIVARTKHGLEVIDGQHTAIAAASHEHINRIPVMIVEAASQVDRAGAFVGHNRDRIGLTPIQIHFASVLAGDEDAMTLQQVCDRAGVTLLRFPPGNGQYGIGETQGIEAIRGVIRRRFAAGAGRVLRTATAARLAPLRREQVLAIEHLLFADEYRGAASEEAIVTTFLKLGPRLDQEAQVARLAHKLPMWRALAATLYRNGAHARKRAS